MTENQASKLLRLIRRRGIVRASEVSELGIPRKYLAILEKEGAIVKQGRGLYSLADAAVTDRHTLALACKSVPVGIVCLVSALQFLNIGTQLPFQVWTAIPSHSYRPSLEYPLLMHGSGVTKPVLPLMLAAWEKLLEELKLYWRLFELSAQNRLLKKRGNSSRRNATAGGA
jgi:hypothetical protein